MSTSKGKSTTVTFRISRSDLDRWQASADRNGLTLSEYVRRRVNERPLKASKPRYAEAVAEQRRKLLAAAEEAETAKLRAERNRAYERRAQADRLVAEAGSVEGWYANMSLPERQSWMDLKTDLLAAERIAREAAAVRLNIPENTATGKTKWDELLADYLSSESVPLEPPGPAPKREETAAEKLQREKAAWERARMEAADETGIRW